MSNPIRRGQSSSQVSSWSQSDIVTPNAQTSFILPYGLRLQQTITSSGSVSIPAGITWVYVIMTSGGGGSYFGYSGNGGEVTWGWTLSQNTCIVGAGGTDGNNGGYTRYGHLIATGVGTRGGSLQRPTNYYGQPPGTSYGDTSGVIAGLPGANAGNGSNGNSGFQGGNGGSGISGGAGGGGQATTGTSLGGLGGSGLTGGGGGRGYGTTTDSRIGGNGGNAIGIDGTTYTGGTGGTGTAGSGTNGGGGGGAGIAGNGNNGVSNSNSGGTGGLGGGGAGGTGTGGAGILYIFY